ERREMFFNVSSNDLKDVAAKYLASDDSGAQSSVAVIGEEGLDISGEWKRVHLQ
ncbi:hypothetical protein GGI22_005241, partial [Coemansia erecta]